MNAVLEVLLKAKDELSNVVKNAGKEADSLGSKLNSIGTKAALGFAAAGAAAGAFAAVSISDFTSFERKMNEAYTLMPGISQDAMDKMSGDVKQFSKDFGVLPEKVVPALYQSLSAGVPPDNVFSFLETAQKAAKGGVTDLETAVNGISSTVNAYGADMLEAGKASDLMFTAVRLGKTSFGEMSASMANVVPTAASLGVGFDQVTAGLTQLTLKGVPTAQATTQLRAAMLEASKGGTKLDTAIRDLTGKSFQQLIEGGGDIGSILTQVKTATENSGNSFNDLFGSAEALSAGLILTSGDGAEFSKILGDMQNSAGATDGAFSQMEQGIGPKIDKLKAQFAVLKLEVGEKLAPVVIALLSWLIATGIPAIQGFAESMKPVVLQAVALGQELGTKLMPYLIQLAGIFTDTILPIGKQIVDFFMQNEQASQALGVAVGSVLVVAFLALAVSAGAAAVSMVIAAAPVVGLVAAIGLLGAGIFLLVQNWDTITAKIPALGAAFTIAQGAVTAAFDIIEGLFDAFVGIIEAQLAIWEGLFSVFHGILTGDFEEAWEGIKKIIDGALGVIKGIFNIQLAPIKALWENFGDDIKQLGIDAVSAVVDEFKAMPGKLLGLVGDIGSSASSIGGAILDGLGKGLSATGGFVTAVGGEIVKAVKAMVNTGVIDPINRALEFHVGGSILGKDWGVTINPPDIPYLAMGGIVNGPTMAMLGDNASGREMVVPLERASEMGFSKGGNTTIIVQAPPGFGSSDDAYAKRLLDILRNAGATI